MSSWCFSCPEEPLATCSLHSGSHLGGWEEHKKGKAGDRRERGLRGYWTVIKPPPHTYWPRRPLAVLFLGGESGGPGAEPGPLSQRLAPQCARESHHRPSQPDAGSMWLRVGTCPQHGILPPRHWIPQPGPSVSQLALKPGFLRQKSLLAFISKWLHSAWRPGRPRCPSQ